MFKPGISGNAKGRPQGAKGKASTELRERIKTFLDGSFDDMQEDFKKLDPVQKLNFYERLLKFAVPVMSSQDLKMNFEDLSESQLDEIINRLINKQ